MNHALLKIVASVALGNIPTGADANFPEWKGPDHTMVHVQALFYSSLSVTFLAAIVAILGKQWLNRYTSVGHGSIIDRGRDRKCKMDGIVTWKFDLVMECLPLMLQVALLLFGYALSKYLSSINKAIAGIIIGFITSGLLFYLLLVSVATFSYNCPFQTPISLILHSLIRFDNKHKKYLKQSREWFGHILAQMGQLRLGSGGSNGLSGCGTFNGNDSSDHVGLLVIPSPHPPQLFNQEDNWDGHVLDSNCITRMFKMSTEVDTALAIARFIPEIIWHTGIQDIPLERLYDTVLECFDHSSGYPILKPVFRNKAYLSARALLHMDIQRRCIGDGSESAAFGSISKKHQIMASEHYKRDSDLGSTLGIIDHVFGDFKPKPTIHWESFSLTIAHHTWMGHILLCHAWDIHKNGESLPDSVRGFILHSLQLEPAPPAQIIADCLFMIGLVLGIELHVKDLLVTDKR